MKFPFAGGRWLVPIQKFLSRFPTCMQPLLPKILVFRRHIIRKGIQSGLKHALDCLFHHDQSEAEARQHSAHSHRLAQPHTG
jgi:hypothetical protein